LLLWDMFVTTQQRQIKFDNHTGTSDSRNR